MIMLYCMVNGLYPYLMTQKPCNNLLGCQDQSFPSSSERVYMKTDTFFAFFLHHTASLLLYGK